MKNKLLKTSLTELRDSLYPSFKEFEDKFKPLYASFLNDSQDELVHAGNEIAMIFNTMIAKEFIVVNSSGNHENFFKSLVEYFKTKGASVDFCTSRKKNYLEWDDYSLAEKLSQKYESLSIVMFVYIGKKMRDEGGSFEDVNSSGVKFFYDNFAEILSFFLSNGIFMDRNRCEVCGENPELKIDGIHLSIEYQLECN